MCWPGLLQLGSDEWGRMISLQTINYTLGTTATHIHVYLWAHVCVRVYMHCVWKWYIIQRMDTCTCFYRYISYILMQNIFQSLIIISYLYTSHLFTHAHTIQYSRNVYTTLQQIHQKTSTVYISHHNFTCTSSSETSLQNDTTYRWGQDRFTLSLST